MQITRNKLSQRIANIGMAVVVALGAVTPFVSAPTASAASSGPLTVESICNAEGKVALKFTLKEQISTWLTGDVYYKTPYGETKQSLPAGDVDTWTVSTNLVQAPSATVTAEAVGVSYLFFIPLYKKYTVATDQKNCDVDAPVITITSPATDIYSRSGFTGSFVATDNEALNNVSFYLKNNADATVDNGTGASNLWQYPDWRQSYSGSYNFVTSGLPDGVYTLMARVNDQAGNWGTDETRVVTVDNTKPDGTVTSSAPIMNNDGTITVTASDANGLKKVSFVTEGEGAGKPYKVWQDFAGATSATRTVSLSALTNGLYNDGLHTIKVSIEDLAGNIKVLSLYSFTVDATMPTVKVNLNRASYVNSGDTVRKSQVPEIEAYDTNLDRIELYKNGNKVTEWLANSSSRRAKIDWLGEGAYVIKAIDKAGNESVEFTVKVDNTKPVVSIVEPLLNSINPVVIKIDATDNMALNKVTANIYDENNSQLIKPCSKVATPAQTTAYQLVCPISDLADGVYTIRTNASDMSGAVAQTLTRQFTIDTVGPELAILSYDTLANVVTPNVTATDLTDVTFAWTQTSGTVGGVSVSDVTEMAPDFTVAQDGTYTFKLTATDEAGNSNSAEFTFSYTTPVVVVPATTPTTTLINQTPTTGDGFTNVAVVTTPDEEPEVQGVSTQNSGVEGEEEILGTTTTPGQQGGGEFAPLGLSWYWWIPMLSAGGAAAWWLFALMRRGEE